MTALEPLQELQRILGGNLKGPYEMSRADGHERKPQWQWQAWWPVAPKAYARLRPYLSAEKQEQGDRALECVRNEHSDAPQLREKNGRFT